MQFTLNTNKTRPNQPKIQIRIQNIDKLFYWDKTGQRIGDAAKRQM